MIHATRFAHYLGCLSMVLSSCGKPSPTIPKTIVEVLAISSLPEPDRIPYPHAAAVCRCRTDAGEAILVALPALHDRKRIADFEKIETGSRIAIQLIPWDRRPAEVRAMFIANDYKHLFDLPFYFGQSLAFP